jgi:hypothetical protein
MAEHKTVKPVERRRRGDMIETYKIMKGIATTDKNTWFEMQEMEDYEVRRTRTNMRINEEGEPERIENVIKGKKSKTDLRKNFFSQRVAYAMTEMVYRTR